MRKILLPLDFAAVGFVIAAAVAALMLSSAVAYGGSSDFATVAYSSGELTVDLTRDGVYEVTSNGYLIVLTVLDGSLSVDTDCPDRLCCGTISRPGQTLVCLPARAVITIGGERAHDAIVG